MYEMKEVTVGSYSYLILQQPQKISNLHSMKSTRL
jgi:hypothetical protein